MNLISHAYFGLLQEEPDIIEVGSMLISANASIINTVIPTWETVNDVPVDILRLYETSLPCNFRHHLTLDSMVLEIPKGNNFTWYCEGENISANGAIFYNLVTGVLYAVTSFGATHHANDKISVLFTSSYGQIASFPYKSYKIAHDAGAYAT